MGKKLDRAFTELPWPNLLKEIVDIDVFLTAIYQLAGIGMHGNGGSKALGAFLPSSGEAPQVSNQ